jgi:hypothetical protein
MTVTPHKDPSAKELLHPDLAWRHAKWRLAWLLEDDEADRRTRVGRRHRHRLTRTTRLMHGRPGTRKARR